MWTTVLNYFPPMPFHWYISGTFSVVTVYFCNWFRLPEEFKKISNFKKRYLWYLGIPMILGPGIDKTSDSKLKRKSKSNFHFSGLGTLPVGISLLSGARGVPMDLGISLSSGQRNLCLGHTGGKLPSCRTKLSKLLRSHFPRIALYGI